ncbi:MAG: transaldolase family protein, partial [Dehalococcoidales bacterium]|jgi:transaldolase
VETLNAYRNHGEPADRIEQEITGARRMLEQLPELGICLDDVTQQLENEGVSKFNQSFDQLMGSMRQAVYK